MVLYCIHTNLHKFTPNLYQKVPSSFTPSLIHLINLPMFTLHSPKNTKHTRVQTLSLTHTNTHSHNLSHTHKHTHTKNHFISAKFSYSRCFFVFCAFLFLFPLPPPQKKTSRGIEEKETQEIEPNVLISLAKKWGKQLASFRPLNSTHILSSIHVYFWLSMQRKMACLQFENIDG